MKPVYLVLLFLLSALSVQRNAAAQETPHVTRSDVWLQASIDTAFQLNPHLNSHQIESHVDKGVVTLRGTVDDSIRKELAEEIARSFDGVLEVRNEIEVAPGSDTEGGAETRTFTGKVLDATLTASVKSRLLWNRHTSGIAINVDSMDGIVTLSGTVASAEERQLAALITENTRGVRRVENRIRVEGEGSSPLAFGNLDTDRVKENFDSVTESARTALDRQFDKDKIARNSESVLSTLNKEARDGWVAAKVKSTLLYTAGLDALNIQVNADNGVVTLSGTVQSTQEKDYAAKLAADVVGVNKVNNRLGVLH